MVKLDFQPKLFSTLKNYTKTDFTTLFPYTTLFRSYYCRYSSIASCHRIRYSFRSKS